MSTLTVNTQDDSVVDGWVGRKFVNESFAALLAGAGTDDLGYNDPTVYAQYAASSTSNQWERCLCGAFLFDVQAYIPDGAVVTAGVLTLTVAAAVTDAFGAEVVLRNAPLTNYTSVVNGDYAAMQGDKTEHGTARYAITGKTTGDLINFTLNSTALTTLASTLVSGNPFELGVELDATFDETPPTWSSLGNSVIQFASAQHGTSAYRPYLTLTYYIESGYATVKITATKQSAGDGVTADLFVIEPFTETK